MFNMKIAEFESETGKELKATAEASTCFLPISIKSSYSKKDEEKSIEEKITETTDSEDLAEQVALINRAFPRGKCRVVIADSLNRHTERMKNGRMSEEETNTQSLVAGMKWKERNQHILDRLAVPYEVTHWEDWRQHPQYTEKRAEIDQKYAEKKIFFSSVNRIMFKLIQSFVSAQEKDKEMICVELDLQAASDLCREYLLEEIAVFDIWKDNLHPGLLGNTPNSFVAYAFGNSSSNKTIFNCFKQFCTENFQLLNFVKLENAASKKSKSKKEQKKASSPPREKSRQDAPSSAATSPEEEFMLTLLGNMIDGTLSTIQVSPLSIGAQIAFLQGVEHRVHEMSAQLRQKTRSLPTTHDELFASQSVEKKAQHIDSILVSSESPNLYKAKFKDPFYADNRIETDTLTPQPEEIAQLRINITTTDSSKLALSPISGSFDRNEVFFKTEKTTFDQVKLKQYNPT